MASDRVNMPMSTAGITRYFDDFKSKVEFTPGQIIVLIIVVIILEILFNWQGNAWFGLT